MAAANACAACGFHGPLNGRVHRGRHGALLLARGCEVGGDTLDAALDWLVWRGRLCAWCRKREPTRYVNLPGNWLPTRVCDPCFEEESEDGETARDIGWRDVCTDCDGTGDPTGEGLDTCDTCEGEGVLDPA